MHVHLGLVFHQHQPLGNFGFVFEELYQKSYEPLVACLERHPGVKAGLHYSGPLLDWLSVEKPAFIARVREMVESGQIEILGGGYYEPILPAISADDRVGQLRKLREAVYEHFGVTPTGMWLPERVWEPALPRAINEAGYTWTIVDDVHFEGAGIEAADVRGWYLTEDEGRVLGLYGSSTPFRYLVPWGTVDECIRYLGAHGDRAPGSLLVFGDDGEKFGGWPTTFAHCWEEGWVDAFFGRLEQESHWLETVHLGAWRKERPPVSRAYLPAASYMEMAQWSLPPAAQMQLENARAILRSNGRDDLTQFVRGGHWRNFLVRYPEVNLLHKRLLALSVVAHEKNDKEALEAIWKAQCNCPWWHGVFGGVYLEHIRHANFAHLAAADAALYGGPQAPEVRDWDYDGRDEVCLRSEEHLVVVDPDDSGTLLHWELRTVPWHLTHVVARRPEAYHAELTTNHDEGVHSIHDGTRLKDPGALAVANVYDRGMRLAAQETILPTGATREHYAAERLSGPPSGNEWHVGEDGSVFVTSIREGLPPITRRVSLAMGLQVRTEGAPDESIFSEWNLSLPDDASAPTTITLEPGIASIRSALFSLTARHSGDDSWYERVFAASNTEEGVALEPQGWSIVFRGCGSLEVTWQKE